nr:reverse transcriptase domain-containing protein [Tanacetum cinerariifolium]
RSSARNLFPPLDNPELTIRRRPRVDPTLLNDFEMAIDGNGDPSVPDLRTMEELCQPTMNGRCGPVASIAIQATNFGLKNDMIQQFLHHSSANSWQWDLYSSGSGNTLHWQWELILPVGTLSWQWECLVHFIPNSIIINKFPNQIFKNLPFVSLARYGSPLEAKQTLRGATNFGLKNDMIQQVQNYCQFHGLPGDDANKHLDKFLHVT